MIQRFSRQFKNTLGSNVIIILLFAIGIGGSTSIYAVMRPVLLKPLPYERPNRIVAIWENRPDTKRLQVSSMDAEDFLVRTHVFQQASTYRIWIPNVSGRSPAEQLPVAKVSPDFFKLLGVAPIMGRQFGAADFVGTQPVAVISAHVWRELFSEDASVLTQTIKINGEPYSVIGVMPASFDFPFSPSKTEVWTPLVSSNTEQNSRAVHNLLMIARLQNGFSLKQAQEEISAVAKQLSLEHPDTNAKIGVALHSLLAESTEAYYEGLLTLLSASGLILLISCLNSSSLLLARSLANQKAIVIQRVLGATDIRIIRSQLLESVLLALFGATGGLILAKLCLAAASIFIKDMPRANDIKIDLPVAGFAILVSILCALFSSIAPTIQLCSRDFRRAALEQGGETVTARTRRLQTFLIVAETALAFVMLVGTGLLVRTVASLRAVPVGFNPKNVLAMKFVLPQNRYSADSSRNQFVKKILGELEQSPSVQSVAAASPLPWQGAIGMSVNKHSEPEHNFQANLIICTPDFFKLLEIPLRQGRPFNEQDDDAGMPVAIINEAMARRNWPNLNPIGQVVDVEQAGTRTIIGIVGDFHQLGFKVAPAPAIFVPFSQLPRSYMGVLVRTASNPIGMTKVIRTKVAAVDPDVPPAALRTLDDAMFKSIQQQIFIAGLLIAFSSISLILTITGLYGFIARLILLRKREFAVRIALGASHRDVLKLVMKNGMLLTTIGIISGVLCAMLATNIIKSLLWHVTSKDPLTFIGSAVLIWSVSLAAIYLPAHRTMYIDPSRSLREQ
jgi:putative ABC transport system permease protein